MDELREQTQGHSADEREAAGAQLKTMRRYHNEFCE